MYVYTCICTYVYVFFFTFNQNEVAFSNGSTHFLSRLSFSALYFIFIILLIANNMNRVNSLNSQQFQQQSDDIVHLVIIYLRELLLYFLLYMDFYVNK